MSRTGDGKCPDIGQWCGVDRDLCDGNCMVKRIEDLEAENARLKAALRPVLKCDVLDCDQNVHAELPAYATIVRCHNAVRMAQRIYNGGAE